MDANNLLVDKSMKQITFREEVIQRAKMLQEHVAFSVEKWGR